MAGPGERVVLFGAEPFGERRARCRTLLKIAKEHKVPVQFDCQDGECGHCLVRVTSVDAKDRMGYHLTEKEITVLKTLGKITQDDVDRLAVDDMPSEWRLACQMIVRDEDILVEY